MSQALPFLLLQRQHVRGHRSNNDPGCSSQIDTCRAQVFRSVVGHYIAGTAGDKELDDALAACNELCWDWYLEGTCDLFNLGH